MLNNTLDELHAEVKRLDSLLEDRQIGLSSWTMFLKERVVAIKTIAKRLGM